MTRARDGRAPVRSDGSGLVAERFAGAQVLLIRLFGRDHIEYVGVALLWRRFGFNNEDRLHRLVIAFAIILRTFVIIVLQRFDRSDHLVGVEAASSMVSHHPRFHTGM